MNELLHPIRVLFTVRKLDARVYVDSIRSYFLDGLNDAQRRAALAVSGPVAILAGAGTGKTPCAIFVEVLEVAEA